MLPPPILNFSTLRTFSPYPPRGVPDSVFVDFSFPSEINYPEKEILLYYIYTINHQNNQGKYQKKIRLTILPKATA